MNQPFVSIVIPTHNRKEMLLRLLRSILESSYTKLEIIVIDDASTDGTSNAIKTLFTNEDKIRVIRNSKNLYAAGSRNVGIKHAKGKYIFFIDDDNVLDREAIGRLVEQFEKDKNIGELGLVNYSFVHKKQVLWLYTSRNMWTSKTYLPNTFKDFFHNEIWDTVDVPNAFMIRADILKKNNIMFCSFFGIMYEESYVAYRIREVGYTIKVVRDAKIYHDVDDFMPHYMDDRRRLYVFARNRVIFHSLYSTKFQLLSIILFWIWAFMLYYAYLVFQYKSDKKYSFCEKMDLVMQYIKGNFRGIAFVIRREKLNYT